MKLYTLILALICTSSVFANIDFKAHIKINGQDKLMVKPGVPTLVELYFTDPRTSEVYKNFKEMHGKLMHMVLIKSDLSVFKHVHPYFDPITGRFSFVLNMPYSDPDNFDGVNTLVEPGMYMLMADVEIKHVGMRMAHINLMAMGKPEKRHLMLDPTNHDGSVTKILKVKNNERMIEYKSILRVTSIKGHAGDLVSLNVEMFVKEDGEFKPLLDFQPWLSEAAHSVWTSEGFMKLDHGHSQHGAEQMMKMPYAHMHSSFVLNDDGTYTKVEDHILRFNFHDQHQMKKGKQKMWIQFRHEGKVNKINFVFDYKSMGHGHGHN